MTTTATYDGASFIAPLTVRLEIDGCTVHIAPLVLRDLPRVLTLLVPLMAALPPAAPGLLKRLQSGTASDAELTGIVTALAVNGDDVIALLALCTRAHELPALGDAPPTLVDGPLHLAWVGGLLLDRVVALALDCIKVNADFFMQAIQPMRALVSRLQPGAAAAPRAAPSSSTTPTPSPS